MREGKEGGGMILGVEEGEWEEGRKRVNREKKGGRRRGGVNGRGGE